jgi:CRISPR/Cas system CSM-associated protein Csm3 (group 7 of RAMP superfamily)
LKIEFNLRLKAIGLLTVGWGIPELIGADVLHIRKPRYNGGSVEEVYYIPGSSVKGVLRSISSKIASFYGFSSCGEIEPSRIRDRHGKMGKLCDVCRLFGYPQKEPWEKGLSSYLKVSDFNAVGDVETVKLTRTSLDLRRLIVKTGALYTIEHVLPGTEFIGKIKLEESIRSLLPLLLLAIAGLRIDSFGRRSIVDAKIEDGGILEEFVESRWLPLVSGLREWMWVEVAK